MNNSTIQSRAARYGTSLCRPSEVELQAYEEKINAMGDRQFVSECGSMIFMSAYAANNPRACWHWMVDACYACAVQRGGEHAPLYDLAYKQVASEQGISV